MQRSVIWVPKIRSLVYFSITLFYLNIDHIDTERSSLFSPEKEKQEVEISLLIKSLVHLKEISIIPTHTSVTTIRYSFTLVFETMEIIIFRPSHNLKTTSNHQHIPTARLEAKEMSQPLLRLQTTRQE